MLRKVPGVWNERAVCRQGWTSIRCLSVWIDNYTYGEYEKLSDSLGTETNGQQVTIPQERFSAFFSHQDTDQALHLFRTFQVHAHESGHYRNMCGTTAGMVTYLLASHRMAIQRTKVSHIITGLTSRQRANGFIPLWRIPKRQHGFPPDVVSALNQLQQDDLLLILPLQLWTERIKGQGLTSGDLSNFLASLAAVCNANTGEREELPLIDSKASPAVSTSGLGLSALIEAHARIYDYFQLIGMIQHSKLKSQLLAEMNAIPEYVAAWLYLQRLCPQATLLDMAIALDIALMPPLLCTYPTGMGRPISWWDIHPVLRYERIVAAFRDRPGMVQLENFVESYSIIAESICTKYGWPFPWAMEASIPRQPQRGQDIAQTHRTHIFSRFALSSHVRANMPFFFAWPWSDHGKRFRAEFSPPLQFWQDGLVWGYPVSVHDSHNMIRAIVVDAAVEDAMLRSGMVQSRIVRSRVLDGVQAEIERSNISSERKRNFIQHIHTELLQVMNTAIHTHFGIALEDFKAISKTSAENVGY